MDMVNRRTELRSPFAAAVNYAYAYTENDSLRCNMSVGITTNLSTRGMSFYTATPVKASQVVTLFNRQLFPEAVGAEARWCLQVSDSIFKVGLMFSARLINPSLLPDLVSKEIPIPEEEVITGASMNVSEKTDMDMGSLRSLKTETNRLLLENKRLRALSVTDDLTGIYNRRYFYERLAEEWNLVERYGHPLSVMILDIDNFKTVNERLGHLIGDALLKEFPGVVKIGLRKGDIFTRYGGDEFAVILPHTSGKAALIAAEHIRRAMESTDFESVKLRRFTLSIGVAEVGRETKDAYEAVRRADRALYEAKRRGKNRVLLWLKGKGPNV